MDAKTNLNKQLKGLAIGTSALLLGAAFSLAHAHQLNNHVYECPSISTVAHHDKGRLVWHAPLGWHVDFKAGSFKRHNYSGYKPHFAQAYLQVFERNNHPKKLYCEYDGGPFDSVQFIISRKRAIMPEGMICKTFGNFACTTGFLPAKWLHNYDGSYNCVADHAYNCHWRTA